MDGSMGHYVSNAEADKITRIMRMLSELSGVRSAHEGQWQETAELIMPSVSGSFTYGNSRTPGEKRTEKQVDSSGMIALGKFGAICDSLLTPRNQTWHGLQASNPYVMKSRRVKLWFEEATRILFHYRYLPAANFASQNQMGFKGLGAFGTAALFVDKLDGGKGMRYKDIPIGELYLIENHQGLVVGYIRAFKLKAHQAMWNPEWKGKIPECIWQAAMKDSQKDFDFIQYVNLRGDYDPDRIDSKGMKYESCYLSIDGRCLLSEGGYRSLPLAASRYEQYPNEVYGRGPATFVLPSLKTLNAQKKMFLKQGHRAADPVLLRYDDGLVDFSLKPGAMNAGGVSADGRPLVHVLPTGNIQVSEEMMDREASTIDDAFLVSLFQLMTETKRMSATEIIERVAEKGVLLAPTVGRQADERYGPTIDRELDLLVDQNLLPPMPPELREAEGAYSVVYKSPLARAARAQEAGGFTRTLEIVRELVNVTQDASLLDPFDFDVAIPDIAEIQNVPASWMASGEKIQDKREARAKQQQRQEQIQAAPAAAALRKSEIEAAQAGVQ